MFSAVNATEKENLIRSHHKSKRFLGKLWDEFLYPSNPTYSLSFFTNQYLYLRAESFCEDMSDEMGEEFTLSDLVQSLYIDFLSYARQKAKLTDILKRFQARELTQFILTPYQTPDATKGVLFEEIRGFQKVIVKLPHKMVLRGEFILRDLLEYQEHSYTVENILEIVFHTFMDEYRRGYIENPIQKISQYAEELE